MTFQVKAEILLANDNWERNLKKSAKQLRGLEKTVKSVANSIKFAWLAVAALGLDALGNAIVDVTKAAAEDAKSQALLAQQLKNSWKATTAQTAAVEEYINQASNMSAIADDKLRPAFAKIVAVTKNSTKAFKAFDIVMDVSAGTGKDVNVVAQAMAKFLGGNKTALDKIIPGFKEAGRSMAFLTEKYGGMAAIAGSNDPFAKISVVMDNFKEKLGTAFLPVVQKFADWLASPEAQKMLDGLAEKVQKFGEWFASPEGQEAFAGWMDDLKTLIELAGEFLGMVADVIKLFNQKRTPQPTELGYQIPKDTFTNPTKYGLPNPTHTVPGGGTGLQTNIFNINVPNASGESVLNAIKGEARRRGVALSKLLG